MTTYATLSDGCTFIRLPARTHIELLGADRQQFLHNFCTNDIKGLQPGTGCEAFITSVQGKTLGHILVFSGTESLALDTVPNQSEPLIRHLDRYLITEDVQIADRSTEWLELAVAGSNATHVLRQCGLDVPVAPLNHIDGRIDGHAVSVRWVDMITAPCFFVRTAGNDQVVLIEKLREHGATECKADVLETARIEQGWPCFGVDITERNLPQEINRNERAISFTKGCYLGQETVARIDALGHVNRLLVGLRFDGKEIPVPGTKLLAGEKEVGEVTSATFSPRLGAPLAIGFVRHEHANVGAELQSVLGLAIVITLPIDRKS
jgi:folate-binding protein YgfZ